MDTVFLVVDDDSMVRDILIQYLKSFGFQNILDAKDGKVALKIVRNPNQHIDFIISDWEMPHVDGLTLLRAVRQEPCRRDTKFMMVTSQGSHERMKISKAAKSRVDAYIVKPFRGELLKQKVTTLLNGEIDESAAEFDTEILGLPRPGGIIVMKDKNKPGHVNYVPGTQPKSINIGNRAGAVENAGKVFTGGEFDPEKPPEEVDVTTMNIILILKLVNSYKKIKWFDKAIKLCLDADLHFPDNADILFNLGHCYFLKAQFPEAEEALRKAIKIKPYHVESFSLLSEMQRVAKAS